MFFSNSFLPLPSLLLYLCLRTPAVQAQSAADGLLVLTGHAAASVTSSAALPSATGELATLSNSFSSIAASNSSVASSTDSIIILTGSSRTSSSANFRTDLLNQTASATSAAPTPTNIQPCNNYVEFCDRQYGNITQVCAHNSPFVKPNNVASNQDFGVITQLNDGIRMLQIQTHLANGTLYLCHSSCDILNAGTMVSYLSTVAGWVRTHPYDIITILIGNGDYSAVGNFTAPIEESGLLPFVYTPPKNPMSLGDWPKLSSMILSSSRVVIFMDYQSNQTSVPYILDEFVHIWETPFDPIDRSFPCTIQRPPGLSDHDAGFRMYMINHNLNTQLSLLGNTLLVPTVPLLNVTNGVNGSGSLGQTAQQCAERWGRPPTWLNVDFYNMGNGSVFEVAAKWNNVTYDRTCCGLPANGAERSRVGLGVVLVALLVAAVLV